MGYGEERENASNQELEVADFWMKIWEELHTMAARDMAVEVEHVKAQAHRTKKEKKEMSHFERLVTEGNEKAHSLAKAGGLLDEGFMAEARAETIQQELEEVFAALQYAASFQCLVEEWKDREELKLKPKEKLISVDQEKRGDESCDGVARGNQQVSVLEVWKSSKYMKLPGKCRGPKNLSGLFWTMEKTSFGRS